MTGKSAAAAAADFWNFSQKCSWTQSIDRIHMQSRDEWMPISRTHLNSEWEREKNLKCKTQSADVCNEPIESRQWMKFTPTNQTKCLPQRCNFHAVPTLRLGMVESSLLSQKAQGKSDSDRVSDSASQGIFCGLDWRFIFRAADEKTSSEARPVA